MTHPRQSTVSPILKPVSSPKRQASQRKPFALSSVSTQTSSHLRIHGTSVPSMRPTFAPPAPVAPQLRLSCALPDTPSLPKVACNSRTGVTHQHEAIQTSNILRGNYMRNCRAPHCAPRKVARNSPRTSFTNSSKTAEYQRSHFKTRNILRGITCEIAAPEAASRARGHPSPPGAQRAQAATHPDR